METLLFSNAKLKIQIGEKASPNNEEMIIVEVEALESGLKVILPLTATEAEIFCHRLNDKAEEIKKHFWNRNHAG